MMCHAFIEGWIDKELEKNRYTEKWEYEMLRRLSFSLDITDARNADFVIEAVPENADLKK